MVVTAAVADGGGDGGGGGGGDVQFRIQSRGPRPEPKSDWVENRCLEGSCGWDVGITKRSRSAQKKELVIEFRRSGDDDNEWEAKDKECDGS